MMMEQLKSYRIPVMSAAAALLVFVVVYLAWIAPESSKLSSLRTNESQLQSQQMSLQVQINSLRREKANLGPTCATLAQAITEVPSAPDVDSFLQQVTQLAVSSGDPNTPSISVTEASGTTKAVAGATPVAVSFSLAGSYAQMSAFLKGLYSFPRLFTISSISIASGSGTAGGGAAHLVPAPAGGGGGYNLTLNGTIYYSASQVDACNTSAK